MLALQSSPFQNTGGVPWALRTNERKSSCLILDVYSWSEAVTNYTFVVRHMRVHSRLCCRPAGQDFCACAVAAAAVIYLRAKKTLTEILVILVCRIVKWIWLYRLGPYGIRKELGPYLQIFARWGTSNWGQGRKVSIYILFLVCQQGLKALYASCNSILSHKRPVPPFVTHQSLQTTNILPLTLVFLVSYIWSLPVIHMLADCEIVKQ